MKFGILKRFVELGWAVLLSDVDISVLQVGCVMWTAASCMCADFGHHQRLYSSIKFTHEEEQTNQCLYFYFKQWKNKHCIGC